MCVVRRLERIIEWLGQYIFETIEEVRDHATRGLWTYNNERPNMGLGRDHPRSETKTHRVSSIYRPH